MDSVANVPLVVPLHGSAGIFGPSCELCAQLAAGEVNAADGVLRRELRLSVIDGAAAPRVVVARVGELAAAGRVDAVVGWHISAVSGDCGLGATVRGPSGGVIAHETFVPLGCRDWHGALADVRRSRAEAVIMLLVGADAVGFNRAFAAAGLDADCLRLSTLIDENTLVGSGADGTQGSARRRATSRRSLAGKPRLRLALHAALQPGTPRRSTASASPATRAWSC